MDAGQWRLGPDPDDHDEPFKLSPPIFSTSDRQNQQIAQSATILWANQQPHEPIYVPGGSMGENAPLLGKVQSRSANLLNGSQVHRNPSPTAPAAAPARIGPDSTAPPAEQHVLQPIPWFGIVMFVGMLAGFTFQCYLADFKAAPLVDNAMIGPPIGVLVAAGAKDTPLIVLNREYWRLITPLFLHVGVVHLGCNSWILCKHGFQLERNASWVRFAPIYLASGILSIAASAVLLPTKITVGASGAMFGILGSQWGDFAQNWYTVVSSPDHEYGAGGCFKDFFVLAVVTVVNLGLGLVPIVDNFAHAFGCVGGVLLGCFCLVRGKERSSCQICAAWGSLAVYFFLLGGMCIALALEHDVTEYCHWCKYISCVPTPLWDCEYNTVNMTAPTTS